MVFKTSLSTYAKLFWSRRIVALTCHWCVKMPPIASKMHFVKPLDLFPLTLSECFSCFQTAFAIYMCIIFCQSLFFSHFILHSQDLSSWNPLKAVSCQRKSDKTDIWESNQHSPTTHPSALFSLVPLSSRFSVLPSLILSQSLSPSPLVTLHLWECVNCQPDVESHCRHCHICAETSARSPPLSVSPSWVTRSIQFPFSRVFFFFALGYARLPVKHARACKFVCMFASYTCQKMEPCLPPPCASLRDASAMVCGGKRHVRLRDSSKHNGSIHQEEPEIGSMRAWGRDRRNMSESVRQRDGRK